jgi:predicted transcriptional regulator
LKEACRKLNISYRRGSRTIVKLMSLGVIRSHTTEKEEYYTAT